MLGAVGLPSLICNFKFQTVLKIWFLGGSLAPKTYLGRKLDLK